MAWTCHAVRNNLLNLKPWRRHSGVWLKSFFTYVNFFFFYEFIFFTTRGLINADFKLAGFIFAGLFYRNKYRKIPQLNECYTCKWKICILYYALTLEWIYVLCYLLTLRCHQKLFPLNVRTLQQNSPPLQKLLFSATLTQNPEKLAPLELFKPVLFTSQMESGSRDTDVEHVTGEGC